jgi:hypothetical protein
MKKKGDRSKRLENIENEIEKLLTKKKKKTTTNQIRSELKIKVSWITIQKYLEEMSKGPNAKIIKTTIGDSYKVTFWEIKKADYSS